MGIIYKCTNKLTSRIYIGQSIRSLQERALEHIKELKNKKKKGLWQEDYDLYGRDSFIFEILEESGDILSDLENSYILELNTLEPNGYNKKLGSSNKSEIIRLYKNTMPQIASSLKLLIQPTPFLTIPEISLITGMSVSMLSDLSCGKAYNWLADLYSEDYEIIQSIIDSKLQRDSFFQKDSIEKALLMLIDGLTHKDIATKVGLSIYQVHDISICKTHTWLKNLYPSEYAQLSEKIASKRNKSTTIIDVITGEVFLVINKSEFARNKNLDHRRVSDLINGKMKCIYGRYKIK